MALAADKNTYKKDGQLVSFKVGADVVIYKGALACINAAGFAVPGADEANYQFAGVAYERADNAGGDNGAVSVRLEQTGTYLMTLFGADQASVGKEAYALDDTTVTLIAPTDVVKVGRVVEFVRSNTVRIKIDGYTNIASDDAAMSAATQALADAGTLESYLKNCVQTGLLVGAPTNASTHADSDAFDFNVNISAGIVVVNGVIKEFADQEDFDVDSGAESLIDDTDTDIIYTIVAVETEGTVTLVPVGGSAAEEGEAVAPTDEEVSSVIEHGNWVRIGNTQLHRSGAAACTQTYNNAVRPVLV